ncbi:MAG: SDR family oxidoreductase [Spirochaeta sp.]|jgi:NAD(P)-dependent dehydrogenase (short-subunit alcohol dehydrogenase family)|nr:SDR family oxidoreductase [Spirochaeta sp.]
MQHTDTRAAITGGTQGLGFAVAQKLLLEGAQAVAICGRNGKRGSRAVDELRAYGISLPERVGLAPAEIYYLQADLADPAQATGFVEKAIEKFGTVNALVNNAGLPSRGGLLDTDIETWDRHMAVNLRAPFLTMQAFVRNLKDRGKPGTIVNVLSMVVHCGQSYLTPYSTAKGGLATLTRNVANSFVKDKIRCNGVLTGWMETAGEAEIQKRYHGAGDDWAEQAGKNLPMGQLVQPDQLAGLISYMLSPQSGVMTGSLVDYDQVVAGAYPE